MGQAYTAARTLRHIAAVDADKKAAVSASVEEQDRLFALLRTVFQFSDQAMAQASAVALFQVAAHIRKLCRRKLFSVIAFRQTVQRILPVFCVVHTLHRRRCGTEKDKRLFLDAAPDRHLSRVVARRVLRFIGMLLLLVQNDQPEVTRGGKDSAARADDDLCLAGAGLSYFPLF